MTLLYDCHSLWRPISSKLLFLGSRIILAMFCNQSETLSFKANPRMYQRTKSGGRSRSMTA